MAGLSEQARDLDAVHAGLVRWLRGRRGADSAVTVSPFAINASSGFSSESLLFDLAVTSGGVEQVEPMVLRLAPAGGGLFPEYDLGRQARDAEPARRPWRAGRRARDPRARRDLDRHRLPRHAPHRRAAPRGLHLHPQGMAEGRRARPSSGRAASRSSTSWSTCTASTPRVSTSASSTDPWAAAWPPSSSGGPTTSTGPATAAPTR